MSLVAVGRFFSLQLLNLAQRFKELVHLTYFRPVYLPKYLQNGSQATATKTVIEKMRCSSSSRA